MIARHNDVFALIPYEVATRDRVQQRAQVAPSVSVIITNFNYAQYLGAAVASVLSQTGVQADVVIVDDKSSDDSLAVARRLAQSDGRVRLVALEHNTGPVGAFNEGLRHVTGSYLVRLDADDLLTPGSLARATALAERHPDVGLVYGRPVHFAGTVPTRSRQTASSWTMWSGADWLELRCRKGVNCITSPEVLMRSSVVDHVGGQKELDHTHDMEMWLRMARQTNVARVGGADQAWHREHPASLSARKADVMTDMRDRAKAFGLLFTDTASRHFDDDRLLEVARRAIANEALIRTSQAYAAGRGATAETNAYLAFAQELVPSLEVLPNWAVVRRAQHLGPTRARVSPGILLPAIAHRVRSHLAKSRWEKTGL